MKDNYKFGDIITNGINFWFILGMKKTRCECGNTINHYIEAVPICKSYYKKWYFPSNILKPINIEEIQPRFWLIDN